MNEQELERLVVRLIGDGSSYQKMLQQAEQASAQAANSVGAAASRIEGMTGRLNAFGASAVGVLGGLGASLSGVGLIRSAVQLAADAEQMEISFQTMLQSATLGTQMVRDLTNLAAATPMTLPQLQQGARTLLQFGVAGDQVLPILRMLGDVAGGDSEKMRAMSVAFGQMRSAGRLMGQDLLQMINAGFNPLQEISRTTGRSVQNLRADMEHGRITVDMVTRAFQSATSRGGQFFGLMERQSQSLTGLWSTLQDNVMAVGRTFGKELIDALDLKGVVRAASEAAGVIDGWLKSMSPEVKRVAGAIGIAIATVTALGVAFAVAGLIFNTAFGGIGILIGALVTGGVAIIAWLSSFQEVRDAAAATWRGIQRGIAAVIAWATPTLTSWATTIGGWWDWIKQRAGEAWAYSRQKLDEFLIWARPIWRAFVGYLSASWDIAVRAASAAWDFIKDAAITAWTVISTYATQAWTFLRGIWESIVGDATLSWDEIRTAIIEALIRAEFILDNFGTVADHVWTGIKVGFLGFTGEVEHFFTGTVPALLRWFSSNWRDVFVTSFNFTQTVSSNLASNIVNIIRNIPRLVRGETTFAEIWRPLREGFVNTIRELPVIPPRVMSALEQRLRREFEEQGAALGNSFAEFRARRLREIGGEDVIGLNTEAAVEQAQQAGLRTGNAFAGAAAKEMHKFDAATRYSAEALSRIAAQADRLANPTGANNPATGTSSVAPREAVAAGSAAAQSNIQRQNERMEQLLQQVANNTAQTANRPQNDVHVADL